MPGQIKNMKKLIIFTVAAATVFLASGTAQAAESTKKDVLKFLKKRTTLKEENRQLKEKLEKYPNRISFPIKLVVFHASLALMYGIMRLFLPSALEGFATGWFLLLLYAMALAVFILYDIALTRLISAYLYRLRSRFHIR